MRKLLKYTFLSFLFLLIVFGVYFIVSIYLPNPEISDNSILEKDRIKHSENSFSFENNVLQKNSFGLWEMYLEGSPFERGVAHGKLTQELAEYQEEAFFSQIKLIIPDLNYLRFLKYFIAYFNKDLDNHISQEYKEEIYGVSLFASDKYDFIGPKYHRILNYHGAHDIGHALQDKNMTVGCTSFGVWNSNTSDSSMLIGRNFDFYSGDAFAENKIVLFYNPDSGYKYMTVTWAGFTGVVSGMNENGLTVSINASKSEIPTSTATPIALVAKEILQYSKNIDDAFKIAESRKTFVSESILIGSSENKKCYIIEKTPSKTILYEEKRDVLVCSNHFQSDAFKNDQVNNKNMLESSSLYRKIRMEQLLESHPKMNYEDVAEILRDSKGINNKNIGLGNEKAINQLIAHHGIIFQPKQKKVWVSANPFQLGAFVCYDLDSVFKKMPGLKENKKIHEESLTVATDSFLQSKNYHDFLFYKKGVEVLKTCTKTGVNFPEKLEIAFIKSNPEYFYTYKLLGDYYSSLKNKEKALENYKIALSKEIATGKEKTEIEALMIKLIE